jgi:hypothetical protein
MEGVFGSMARPLAKFGGPLLDTPIDLNVHVAPPSALFEMPQIWLFAENWQTPPEYMVVGLSGSSVRTEVPDGAKNGGPDVTGAPSGVQFVCNCFERASSVDFVFSVLGVLSRSPDHAA